MYQINTTNCSGITAQVTLFRYRFTHSSKYGGGTELFFFVFDYTPL